jgi:hypothetical protein
MSVNGLPLDEAGARRVGHRIQPPARDLSPAGAIPPESRLAGWEQG